MDGNYMGTLPWYETMTEETCIDYERLREEALSHMRYFHLADFDKVGTESFTDGLVRMFVGVLNTIMHVIHTIKTNLFRFYRTLKRTELIYYKESNAVSIKRILNFDYVMINSLEVPIPKKMQGTYKVASENVLAFLNTLDMENRSALFVKQTATLRDRVLAGSEIESAITSVAPEDLPTLTKAFKTANDQFVGPHVNTKPMVKVIPSKEEFNQVFELLLQSAPHQYGVQKVEANLDSSTKHLTDVLHFIQKGTGTITKSDLSNLSNVAMFFAKIFDMYGVAVQDLSRVEHNFVEVMRLIRSKFNL